MKTKLAFLTMVLLGATGIAHADNQRKVDVVSRLQSAAGVLRDIDQAPDKGIPQEVFKAAKCVAVVPSMIKGGFLLAGAKHGRGVSTCRLPNGTWTAPEFFVITGGNFGPQIGVEDVELVMMFMTEQGMRHLLENKVQIGGSVSAAVGPVGRHAEAGTDWKVNTQILAYSRTKGVFAGIDLSGSYLEPDKDSTFAYYGKEYTPEQILTGKVRPPAGAMDPFVAEVRRTQEQSKANGKTSMKKTSKSTQTAQK